MDHASAISPHKEARFQRFIAEMKMCVENEDITRAIEIAEQALTIRDSEKLRRRLAKMKQFQQEVDERDGNDVVDMGDGFYVAKSIEQKLYPYQKDGIRWLWGLFLKGKGGVLGDDMGLGKTFQVIAFLSGLFDQEKIRSVLIAMPVTLMTNWEREFEKWAPDMNVDKFYGTVSQRERVLVRVQRNGGVLLTSYNLIATSSDRLSDYRGRPFTWDYVILDEGHMIKNPSKRTKSVHNIPSKNRIVLTGTPVENKLMELWSIFNFAHHGSLLGGASTFKLEFDGPITKARKKDSTAREKKLGDEISNVLRKRIEPYFLRRTKNQVLNTSSSNKLPTKNDFAVWVCLRPVQVAIYREFLCSNRVAEILRTTKSPLVQLMALKKLCDHPRILSAAACDELQLSGFLSNDCNEVLWKHMSDHELITESGKLEFLIKLLNELKTKGHRTVVFSQSLVMLSIIQRILGTQGFGILRIDGSVAPSDRVLVIDSFQRDKRYHVLLMTSQVGGVGINVTAADRVVIYDPSWNPAVDLQAIDRVYRIGQKRHVIVYRLLTCATVEERIYRRQVFKQSIHKQTVEAAENPFRYFTNQDLRDMFVLDDPTISKTQIQLEKMHSASRVTSEDTDAHIAFLYSLGIFGLSDHDLLFTVPPDDDNDLHGLDEKYIGDHISRANKLVNMECELADTARTQTGAYITPFAVEDKSKPRLGASTAGLKPTQILERDVKLISSGLQQLSPFKVPLACRNVDDSMFQGSVARGVKTDMKKQVGEPPEVIKIDLSDTSGGSLQVDQQEIKTELGNGSLLAQMPVGSRQAKETVAKMELGSESVLSQESVCSRLEESNAEQGSMSSSTQSWKQNSSASNFSGDLNKLNGSERVERKSRGASLPADSSQSQNSEMEVSLTKFQVKSPNKTVDLSSSSSSDLSTDRTSASAKVCESDSILVEETPEKSLSQAARVSGASFAPESDVEDDDSQKATDDAIVPESEDEDFEEEHRRVPAKVVEKEDYDDESPQRGILSSTTIGSALKGSGHHRRSKNFGAHGSALATDLMNISVITSEAEEDESFKASSSSSSTSYSSDDDYKSQSMLDFKTPEPERRGQDSFVKGNRSLIPESDSATDGSSDKVGELPDLGTGLDEWTACIPDFTPGSRAKRIEASKRRRSSMIVKLANSLTMESDDEEEETADDSLYFDASAGKGQGDSNQESEDTFDSDTSDGGGGDTSSENESLILQAGKRRARPLSSDDSS